MNYHRSNLSPNQPGAKCVRCGKRKQHGMQRAKAAARGIVPGAIELSWCTPCRGNLWSVAERREARKAGPRRVPGAVRCANLECTRRLSKRSPYAYCGACAQAGYADAAPAVLATLPVRALPVRCALEGCGAPIEHATTGRPVAAGREALCARHRESAKTLASRARRVA